MTLSEALKDLQLTLGTALSLEQAVLYLNESASILLPQIEHCLPPDKVELHFTDRKAPLPDQFYKGRALLIKGQTIPYSPPHFFEQAEGCVWTVRDGKVEVSCDTTSALFVFVRKPAPFSPSSNSTNWWTEDPLRWQTLKYLTLTRYLLDKERWSLWTALFKNALDQLQRECSSKKGHYIDGERL